MAKCPGGIFQSAFLLFYLCLSGWSQASPAELAAETKLVSLSPSLTEIVYHLGGGSSLVGRSSACDYPEEVRRVGVCGNFGQPTVEAVLLSGASHLLVSSLQSPAVADTLRRAGIKVHLLPTETVADYYRAVFLIGDILNCRGRAVAEVKRVQTALREYEQLGTDSSRPRVYLEVWDNPLMTVGGNSFINDMISYAGGENIAAGEKQDYFKCASEWVVASKPELIICPAMNIERRGELAARPGWAAIPAIRTQRVYMSLNQDLIYRLGPRFLDGIALLRSCIHPEEKEKEEEAAADDKEF